MSAYTEAFALVATFIASAFAVMRIALRQTQKVTDKFIQHLERTLEQQQSESKLHRDALGKLTGAVEKQSKIIARACRLKPVA